MCSTYDLCVKWKLCSSLSKCFSSINFRDTIYFKEYPTRSNLKAKALWISLSSSHGYFSWLLCIWSVRKHSNPNSSCLSSRSSNYLSSWFKLIWSNIVICCCFKSERTKTQCCTSSFCTNRLRIGSVLLPFSVFYFLWI